MKAVSLLICIFLSTLSFAQETLNQTDENGKKHGTWEVKFPNDNVRYRGQFDHGQPVGTFFYYYEEGGKSSEVTHVDARNATAKMFHLNGRLMAEGNYVDQQRHGEWRFYDSHAVLSSIDPYNHGKLDGIRKVYHVNGQLAAEVPYENGLKNGPFTEYFSNGKVRIQGTYRDNTFDGEFKQYYMDGTVYIKGQYKSAVKDGYWVTYHTDGRVKIQQVYEKGELIKEQITEGFEKEELPYEYEEKDKIDEEKLIEEMMQGGPPR